MMKTRENLLQILREDYSGAKLEDVIEFLHRYLETGIISEEDLFKLQEEGVLK